MLISTIYKEEVMKKFYPLFAVLLVLSFGLAACGGESGGDGTLLGEVIARGYLIGETDPNYEPISYLDPDAVRADDTVCPDELLTYGEMIGFDVDVNKAVADKLGVDICFATPDWDLVTAGSWGDRWDICIGSMTATQTRAEVLSFSTPYVYTPAQFAASADSGITSYADLDGQTICLAVATTYLDWMNGTLTITEDAIFADPPSDVTIVELPTDQECAQSIAAGRPEFSVYLTSAEVINSNIAGGLDVVKVGDPVFSENLSPATDRNSSFDITSFVAEISSIIDGLHADGTLSALSLKWFGVDMTQDPTK
jgi:polar amino acid transport system substrate-binding protein